MYLLFWNRPDSDFVIITSLLEDSKNNPGHRSVHLKRKANKVFPPPNSSTVSRQKHCRITEM